LLGNLCKGHPPPLSKEARPVLEILCRFVKEKIVVKHSDLSGILYAFKEHCPFDLNPSFFTDNIIGEFMSIALDPKAPKCIMIPFTRLLGNLSRGKSNEVRYLVRNNVF
jgi:hypothetical protein